MNNNGIPDRPTQPPLEPFEISELQATVDGELARVDMEDKYGRIGLREKVLVCIARQAERLRDNAGSVAEHNYYTVNSDDMDELDTLLDDLATIEKEGW